MHLATDAAGQTRNAPYASRPARQLRSWQHGINIPVPIRFVRIQSARTSVWSGFSDAKDLKICWLVGNFSELAGFQTRNHSSFHSHMTGRNSWCRKTLEQGLEQCSPTSKYVTCTQS